MPPGSSAPVRPSAASSRSIERIESAWPSRPGRPIAARQWRNAPNPRTTPVGVPSGWRSTEPPGGSASSAPKPQACQRWRVQHRLVVEDLHVARVAGRGEVELGARRRAPLGELRRVPAADHRNPLARRKLAGPLAHERQPLLERRDAAPVHLALPGEPGTQDVRVAVDQPGDDAAPADVELARARSREAPHLRELTDRHDAIAAQHQRLARRVLRATRHPGVGDQQRRVRVRRRERRGVRGVAHPRLIIRRRPARSPYPSLPARASPPPARAPRTASISCSARAGG